MTNNTALATVPTDTPGPSREPWVAPEIQRMTTSAAEQGTGTVTDSTEQLS